MSEDEIISLLLDKDSVNRKQATKVSLGVLQLYLHEKGQSTDFVSLPVASLNKLLKKFYVEARRKDKQPYTKSILMAICLGLCYHIKNSPPDVDIIIGFGMDASGRKYAFQNRRTHKEQKGR